jgi:hypothetical protein
MKFGVLTKFRMTGLTQKLETCVTLHPCCSIRFALQPINPFLALRSCCLHSMNVAGAEVLVTQIIELLADRMEDAR